MSTSFDEIAEVACKDCDWFGMRDDLVTVTRLCCPECKSDDLIDEDDEDDEP